MGEGQVAVPAPVRRKLHDPNIKIEEYFYYARIQRDQERQGLGPKEREEMYQGSSPEAESQNGGSGIGSGDEKVSEKTNTAVAIPQSGAVVSPNEWESASRAVRNASWGSM
jgi:hypothetical protein